VQVNNPLKMEVGIEESLHIEFEYSKAKCAASCRRCGIR
jgi:hypothetical protein